MPGPQVSDIDATIHQLSDNASVIGFVVINMEGIPVKQHDKMPYSKALHYASLIHDFYNRSRLTLKDLFTGPEVRVDLDKHFSERVLKLSHAHEGGYRTDWCSDG